MRCYYLPVPPAPRSSNYSHQQLFAYWRHLPRSISAGLMVSLLHTANNGMTPQSAPGHVFNDKMIFPFRLAEVEQRVQNDISLQGLLWGERRGGAVNNERRLLFWREFVHCTFDNERKWQRGSPANLQKTYWIERRWARTGRGPLISPCRWRDVFRVGGGKMSSIDFTEARQRGEK